LQLMQILIKVADISNEMRPLSVATPWLDCLLAEFFNQVSPKPTHVTKASWRQDHPRGPPTTQLASCLLTLSLLAVFTNMLHLISALTHKTIQAYRVAQKPEPLVRVGQKRSLYSCA